MSLARAEEANLFVTRTLPILKYLGLDKKFYLSIGCGLEFRKVILILNLYAQTILEIKKNRGTAEYIHRKT